MPEKNLCVLLEQINTFLSLVYKSRTTLGTFCVGLHDELPLEEGNKGREGWREREKG
ncbi:hypothetical protein OS493_030704 [Desmophyllum pertusum]|uniref:Uncharacterized protein n=1 Tax=Desmophyllum pertusum TaxID=174260 RepID=A0A9W9ZBQ1_9CNID|nr:hypothetical protein OS493_030704 [Desmophyllum pertusum]